MSTSTKFRYLYFNMYLASYHAWGSLFLQSSKGPFSAVSECDLLLVFCQLVRLDYSLSHVPLLGRTDTPLSARQGKRSDIGQPYSIIKVRRYSTFSIEQKEVK